jgi:hypothetical protein
MISNYAFLERDSMKTIILSAIMYACVAESISAQEPETFKTVLGPEAITGIVHDEQTRFVAELTDMTHVTPEVSRDFDKNVADRVSIVELARPASRNSAEAILRVRFRIFLGNLSTYLLVSTQKVTFDDKSIKNYLDAAAHARRCGEVPCERGCADHKPCDLTCKACSPGSQ